MLLLLFSLNLRKQFMEHVRLFHPIFMSGTPNVEELQLRSDEEIEPLTKNVFSLAQHRTPADGRGGIFE